MATNAIASHWVLQAIRPQLQDGMGPCNRILLGQGEILEFCGPWHIVILTSFIAENLGTLPLLRALKHDGQK